MSNELALQAGLWYNGATKILVPERCLQHPQAWTHLIRRCIMDTLPPHAHKGNSSQRHGPLPRPLPERFWEKVNVKGVNDCWEWNACQYKNGYGKFALTRSNAVYSHRLAYELTYGSIPNGLYVCHSCDNPRCCNPNHLFAGTQTDNMQDCKRKGRNSPPPHKKREVL